MILFLWIKDYRGLENLGVNLTANYSFEMKLRSDDSYELVCQKNDTPNLFKEFVWDIKAIVGKNGVGKSRILSCLIQDLMSDTKVKFNGILVTDKYLLNRGDLEIKFNFSYNGKKVKEIRNVDIVNYSRRDTHRYLDESKSEHRRGEKIIDTYLHDHTILYYAPLINYDRVWEGEYAVSGSAAFEVGPSRYFDLSTEAQILADRDSYAFLKNLDIPTESEILCHKSRESERVINYIIEDGVIPFKLNITHITIHLNQNSINYWESISRLFTFDDEPYSKLSEIFLKFEKIPRSSNKFGNFKNQFLLRVIYHLLRFVADEKSNFSSGENSNPIIDTINELEQKSKDIDTLEELLEKICSSFEVLENFNRLNSEIIAFLELLEVNTKNKEVHISDDYIRVSIREVNILKEFLRFSGGLKVGPGNNRNKNLPVFSYDFDGLSSGEKSFLHLLSRIHAKIKDLDRNSENIVLLLDEPEIAFHPEWQLNFVNFLLKFIREEFRKFKCQVIITSHSPLIISDFPAEHIVFLDKNKVGSLSYYPNTGQLHKCLN
ncbi:AAA family ATPase [Sphingobacterium siyangense]|uniref:AAA family ATPase n=1 Tax=Sphingobacterium siyangense TaxID=459529 RepID=UPI003DA5A61E